jgi:mRNA interferase HigB
MILVGQDVLRRTGRRNAPLRNWLAQWVVTVENATWNNLADVRRMYPSADGVPLKGKLVVTVFNVKGNEYRLLTLIDFESETVEALEVLTHSEYDKDLWKVRY